MSIEYDLEIGISAWMKFNYQDYDNATNLAENCAWALGHDEWLDDPNHIVWDLALNFIEEDQS